jgi:hypothetical protein
MMWTEDYCPICKQKLLRDTIPIDKMYCPTKVNGIYCRSHYERRYGSDNQSYYEQIIIYPYLIDAYSDFCNVYKYNEEGKLSRRLLVEIPLFKINWNDLEATIQKIQLYILMS